MRSVIQVIQGPEDGVLMGLVARVLEWPLDGREQLAAMQEYERRFVVRDVVDLGTGTLAGGGTVIRRTSTGGWAEHGYDDSADKEERSR
jgi:hypothetical protein